MNIAEYIASGKLEECALGHGNAQERAAVEAMLASHPELRGELGEIEESLFQYAQANAVQPSAGLKGRVMAAITEEKKETPVVALNAQRSSRKTNWLAAASIVLLLGSLAGNFMLYDKYQNSNAKVLALESEKTFLATDLGVERAKYSESSNMLSMINSPDTRRVELKGLPLSPESKAMIFWNKESADVYMSVASLPAAPEGMEYQLWAIVEGAPVDAGMIDLSAADNMLRKMKSFESAQAFAVTLEVKGGSSSPTMEKMYVMGAVPS